MFLVPLGVGEQLTAWGIAADRVIELDWWDSHALGRLILTATPAQHFSGRGLTDRNKTLWASWVAAGRAGAVFFSGDSGYGPHYRAIGEALGPFDLTFIENGAYSTNWPFVHHFPEQAVQAHRDIKAALGASALSITDIFRFPTLAGLAAHIDGLGGKTAAPAKTPSAAETPARSETMSKRRLMRAERARGRGPIEASFISTLNELRPHLARAAMIAARMGLQTATTARDAFSKLSVPVILLDLNGDNRLDLVSANAEVIIPVPESSNNVAVRLGAALMLKFKL